MVREKERGNIKKEKERKKILRKERGKQRERGDKRG
jgi:hypothetical protein